MCVAYPGCKASFRRSRLTGHDILFVTMFATAGIRFGPKIWGAFNVHVNQTVTQSGCKLVAYTEFGLRHVNSLLVIGLVAYAWLSVFYPQYDLDVTVNHPPPPFRKQALIFEF